MALTIRMISCFGGFAGSEENYHRETVGVCTIRHLTRLWFMAIHACALHGGVCTYYAGRPDAWLRRDVVARRRALRGPVAPLQTARPGRLD